MSDQTVHQRRALRSQQVAAHDHDGGIQHHGAQTAGDKGAELFRHRFAGGLAAEHERPVGAVGKQDAQSVIQHIAPAVGGSVAEQLAEQRVQQDIQQGGQHAEDQVTEHFPVLFEEFYHGSSNPLRPLALLASTSPEGRGFIAGTASLPSFAKSSPLRESCHRR